MNLSPVAGNCIFAISIAGFSLVCPPTVVAQEYLGSKSIPVATHQKRPSRNTFTAETSGQRSFKTGTTAWGTLFSPNAEARKKLDTGRMISYLDLPACEESKVELKQVYKETSLAKAFDVVFYSGESSAQRAKAKKHGSRTVKYSPALIARKDSGEPDLWQQFARFVSIECLPTRYRFVTIGSKRYEEYRTGDKAWE